MNYTRYEHVTHSHTTSPLRAPSRGVLILTPEEAPLSSERKKENRQPKGGMGVLPLVARAFSLFSAGLNHLAAKLNFTLSTVQV